MNVRTFLESISKLIVEKIFFPKNTVVNVPPDPNHPHLSLKKVILP